MADILYIVVPCYNEEEVLPETSRRLRAKLEGLMAAGKISERSRVLFVNDGSRDRTWELITRLHGGHVAQSHATGAPCSAGRISPATGGTRMPCWRG